VAGGVFRLGLVSRAGRRDRDADLVAGLDQGRPQAPLAERADAGLGGDPVVGGRWVGLVVKQAGVQEP